MTTPLVEQWDMILPMLAQGLATTCLLAVLGSVLAMTLGLVVALCRTRWLGAGVPLVQKLAMAWIDLFRNTPLLCQVLFFYFGFHLGGFVSALLGLCTYTSAFIAEVFRSGFQTVPPEELREARLMGMSRWHIVRYVLLPRSLESSAPSLGNQLMNLTKNTAIAYFVAVGDLTAVFEFLTSQTYHFAEFFLFVLLCYGGLCLAINAVFRRLESYLLRRYEVRGVLQPCP